MEIDRIVVIALCVISFHSAISKKWQWTFYLRGSTWNDASELCFYDGGRHLKLSSSAKFEILRNISQDFSSQWGNPLWLGIYHNAASGSNLWHGECQDEVITTQYSNWESMDRPDNSKPCTMMDAGNFLWKPEACKQNYIFVCESPTEKPDTCARYLVQQAGNTPLCVRAVFDSSTIPPRNYRNTESVVDFGCYTEPNDNSTEETTTKTTSSIVATEVSTQNTATSEIWSSKNVHTLPDTDLGATEGSGTETSSTSTLSLSTTTTPLFDASTVGNQMNMTTMSDTAKSEISTSSVDVKGTTMSSNVTNSSKSIATESTSKSASTCPCHCSKTVNVTDKELQQKIEELINILSINKKETSKSKSKLISAKDNRTSAKTIGFFGVIIIVTLVSIIIFFDVSTYMVNCFQ